MPLFRPAKPKMKIRLSADAPITTGQHVIPLDELVWSEGDATLVAGSGIQVGRPGLYLVIGSLSRAASSNVVQMQTRIFVNGAGLGDSPTVLNAVNTQVTTNECVDVIPLQAGDLVGLAGTFSTTNTINARRVGTFLSVVRIGPERWT